MDNLAINPTALKRKTPEQIEHFFKHAPIRNEADYMELLGILSDIQKGSRRANLDPMFVFAIQTEMALRRYVASLSDEDLKRFGVCRIPVTAA